MRYLFILWNLCVVGNALAQTATVPISNFAAGNLDQWQKKVFHKETHYSLRNQAGQPVLRAHSQASASGLVRKLQVDLTKTPYLHWSWKVEKGPNGLQERTKQGDDYAARIYLLVSDGLFFWQTRSLSYVWSGSEAQGQSWPNAYAKDNLMMVAVQGHKAPHGQWRQQRRNVRQDLRRYLGKDYTTIEAVALMTDTDNSQQEAIAYYGEIYFSSE